MSCNPSTESSDYMGQAYPDTVPMVFAPDLVSVKGRFEHGISFTPDMQELAFGVLRNSDFSGLLYYSKKVDDGWTIPEIFKALKNESVYLPYFSPDGKFLLYTQSKSDTANSYKDIWVIEKNDNRWSNPKKLKVPLNEQSSVSNACMSLDGSIYFSSNINCIGKDNCHTADLFCSKRIENQYQSVDEIHELNSPYDEESVFISPKGDFMILCRYVSDENGPDLLISYRDLNRNWTQPTILDLTINTTDWERRPFVSFDNKYLFFTKLFFDTRGLVESDIYWVNTKRVFKPFVFNPISELTITLGEKTQISIPSDYFKDIDDKKLRLSIGSKDLNWIEFNDEAMVLTMTPNQIGEFELIVTGTDNFSNMTESKVKVSVVE